MTLRDDLRDIQILVDAAITRAASDQATTVLNALAHVPPWLKTARAEAYYAEKRNHERQG